MIAYIMWDEMESVLLFEINSLRQELLNRAKSFLKWYWVTPTNSRSTSSSATQHVPLISKCVDRSVTYEAKQRRVKFRRCFGNIPLAGGNVSVTNIRNSGNEPKAPVMSQISKFMGPTWVPPGSCRPWMGPMLAPWTLLSWILPEPWFLKPYKLVNKGGDI